MSLTLPERFKEKISADNAIKGCLYSLLSKFEEWLSDNSLEFFPEYTDHGISHVQSVINTANELITEESWEIITPEDVYVLVSSILLHDCAMHISKDGLWSLLENERFNGVLLGFGIESPWREKWESYKRSLYKYTESDWLSLFSEYRDVEVPNIGDVSLDDNQKIVIGDFIRKYHANIAQVISVYGIPTKSEKYEIFDHNFNYLNELSGFVARSHNYSLRNMVDMIGSDERGREYRKTHPCYLMGILRLADYLQFSVERTPKVLFHTKGICSPVSIREWKKHFAILSTNKSQPDMELLFVNAYPDDASTLISVQTLLEGLQAELDEFWAVSGEIYSRYDHLKALGIIYRRVKSNIDNAGEYVSSNHKQFYPELLRINSDDQKIYPLLVGPLYGKKPQIGLRELMQNSIDACNERFSVGSNGDSTKSQVPYSIRVTINADENILIISDEGIGMDIDIVKNYFLRIGASFRYSEAWKDMHIVDGVVRLPRTGRFGIGMLAGFLIGDEIGITTRRAGEAEDKAINFRYKLNSESIEVKYCHKNNIGTEITITSNAQILKRLIDGLSIKKRHYYYRHENLEKEQEYGFWYFFDNPEVNIKIVENGEEIKKVNPYLVEKESLFNNWNRIEAITEIDLYWQHNLYHSNTYCNGILIKGLAAPSVTIDAAGYSLEVSDLEIMILDKHNKFPLNLTRNSLVTDDYYEVDEIRKDVLKKLMNAMLDALAKTNFTRNSILRLFSIKIFGYSNLIPFVFYSDEILPIGSELVLKKRKRVVVDFIYQNLDRGIIFNSAFDCVNDCGYLPVLNVEKKADSISSVTRKYLMNSLSKNEEVADSKEDDGRSVAEDLSILEDDDTSMAEDLSILEDDENDNKNSNVKYKTWLYIKKYDLKKLHQYDRKQLEKYNIVSTEINVDWIVLSHQDDVGILPTVGASIIDSKTNAFMFAVCDIVDNCDEKFTASWVSHGLQSSIRIKGIDR